MGAGPVIMILGTEPPPGLEEEWNQWYTEKHVPDVLKFKGARKATRYKISKEMEGQYPRYLAVYEFESKEALDEYMTTSPEHFAALDDWNDNWAPKGAEIKWRIYYEPIKTREK